MENKPKRRKKHIFRKIIAFILVGVLVVGLLGAGYVFNHIKGLIDTRPALNIEKLKTPESTLVFDAKGNQFAEIAQKYSDNIKYEDLPNVVIDAFVSIEDAKFFEHDGFDISRFLVSAIQGLPRMLRGDGFGAGASTITMQTIKNGIFSTDEELADVSIERKVQEISLSLDLEKIVTKKEIFEFYVNRINYGAPNSRGISKAAQYYFGKKVSDLNLSEAAYLAGVINGPGINNAYYNIENATIRRNQVIDLMLRHGYVSITEAELAKAIPLQNLLIGKEKYIQDIERYQEYLDVVIEELYNVYKLDPYRQGLKVYTALVPEQQNLIESLEKGEYDVFTDSRINAAYATLNNQTGEIVAIGGGRKFPDQPTVARAFNNATDLYRQPGSSLKPILPYALAFEYLGYSTKHVIEDGPYAYIGTDIFVFNASRGFTGDITLQDAISFSLNIPAIKTYDAVNNAVGHEAIENYLKGIGLTKNAENVSTVYAIGGGLFEATPLQIAAAHATMMNKGVHIEPHTILRVEVDGQTIEANPKKTQVISEGAAYLTATLLYDAIHHNRYYGTAAHLITDSFPVYGKSGTSDFSDEFEDLGIPAGSIKDNWLVGSTTNYTNIAWNGFVKFFEEDGTPLYTRSSYEANERIADQMNLLLWKTLEFHEPGYLERPDSVESITHVLGVYPYAAPIENMDSKYITSGLILDKYNKLTNLKISEIKLNELKKQNITVGELTSAGLKLDVLLDKYPASDGSNSSGTTTGDGSATKVMTATSASGRTMSAQGVKLFDPAWIFGTIEYVTEVKNGSTVLETNGNDQFKKELVVKNVGSNQDLEVCSYYTFSKNKEVKSNILCNKIKSGSLKLDVPTLVGSDVNSVINWFTENGFTKLSVDYTAPTSHSNINLVASINPSTSTIASAVDTYRNSQITITVYDAVVNNLNSFIGKTVAELLANNPYPQALIIDGALEDKTKVIKAIVADGNAIPSSFRLSEISEIKVEVE